MKVLGLDSSGLVAGVALIQDDVLIAEYTTDYKKTHSQTLLPMLDELRRMVDLDLKSIDLIAVAAGPGSFTGLRIRLCDGKRARACTGDSAGSSADGGCPRL